MRFIYILNRQLNQFNEHVIINTLRLNALLCIRKSMNLMTAHHRAILTSQPNYNTFKSDLKVLSLMTNLS